MSGWSMLPIGAENLSTRLKSYVLLHSNAVKLAIFGCFTVTCTLLLFAVQPPKAIFAENALLQMTSPTQDGTAWANDEDVLSRFRRRDGSAALYFLHISKAGGSTICTSFSDDSTVKTVANLPRRESFQNSSHNCNIFTWEKFQNAPPGLDPDERDPRLEGSLQDQNEIFRELVQNPKWRLDFLANERMLPKDFDRAEGRPWVYMVALRHPYALYWSGMLHFTLKKESVQLSSADIVDDLKRRFSKRTTGSLVYKFTGVEHHYDIEAISVATKVSQALLKNKSYSEIMDLLLFEAKTRLTQFSAIILTSEFESTFAHAKKVLGLSHNLKVKRRGTRGGGEAYEKEEWFANEVVRAALYQKFRYDIEFYQFAERLVKTRMKQQQGHELV